MDKEIKILIVDDFATMRRILKNLLEELGFSHITEAENGSAALKTLTTGCFDLLIVDWNLAAMSGPELLKEIRTNARLQDLPVLIITQGAGREEIVEAAEAGVSGFVVKPFNGFTLQNKIEKIFSRLAVT